MKVWGVVRYGAVILAAVFFFGLQAGVARSEAGLPASVLTPPAGAGETPRPPLSTAPPTPEAGPGRQAEGAQAPGELLFTAVPEAIGWASSLDGRSHFGSPVIHVGSYRGNTYYGAFQFDLSAVPSGGVLRSAWLELTGQDGEHLAGKGTWRLYLLDPAIDEEWSDLSYAELRDAAGGAPVSIDLGLADLAADRVTTFGLGPAQLSALQRRIGGGTASFRLEGPGDGSDNLFTWYGAGAGNKDVPVAPVLHLVVVPATPVPTATYFLITSTPTPENILTVAALAATSTAAARDQAGTTAWTPTPLPHNWVTPFIITPTPTPGNEATAALAAAMATAWSFVQGTPTPLPANVWTATPLPPEPPKLPTLLVGGNAPLSSPPTATAMPLLMSLDLLTPTPTSVPSPAPLPIPDSLRGKIAFVSDRLGPKKVFVMDADGQNVALLTQSYPYDQSLARDVLAPDGARRVFVKNDGHGVPQVFMEDPRYGVTIGVTQLTGPAYDSVWSPNSDRIAFVSSDPGNDEIYVINVDGSGQRRLTQNSWEWDKHPSWSPDGQQIVFYSNRDVGRRQIWVMDDDGSNPHNISNNEFNEWDPVWIK